MSIRSVKKRLAMKSKIALLLILLLSAGCQKAGYFDTNQEIVPQATLSDLVTAEVLASLKTGFAPAKTKILFRHGGEVQSLRLENALRSAGYAVTSDPAEEQGALRFAYTLAKLDKKRTLLRFVAGKEFQVSRVYEQSADGSFAASGPLLVRRD
jgi:hypothetical protein